MAALTLRVRGARDLRAVAKKLRKAGDPKKVRRELLKGLRDAAKPALTEVKSAARAQPAHGPAHSGLRRREARAIGTQVRTSGATAGVRIRMRDDKVGDTLRVGGLMNRQGKVRHPTFGHDPWVTQPGQKGWFDKPLARQRGPVRRQLKKVLDRMEREIR